MSTTYATASGAARAAKRVLGRKTGFKVVSGADGRYTWKEVKASAKEGRLALIKRLLAKDPDMKYDALDTVLREKGVTVAAGTLRTVYWDFRNTYQVLAAEGLIRH